MRRLRRAAARFVGVPLAALVLRALRLSDRKLGIAVLYHGVGELQGDHERELAARHGTRLFEAQLRHLALHYRLVEAEKLLDAVRMRRRGQRFPVAVTFDDDLACHAGVALPILRALHVPATFFLCGASLKAPFAFWWERLQAVVERGVDVPSLGLSGEWATGKVQELGRQIELMSTGQRDALAANLLAVLGSDPPESGIQAHDVRALVEGGMTVGFHTRRHDALTLLDDEALDAAMQHGSRELEDAAGRPLEAVAYPHGRADARVAAAARRAGFRVGFTAAGEPVSAASDPLLLPRIMPYYRSAGQFALQLVLQLLARGHGGRA